MRYFLDTNIILAYIRKTKVADLVTQIRGLVDESEVFVPVVVEGELWSIANQNKWGYPRRHQLARLLGEYQRMDIGNDQTIERYADIDAFSQNKLDGRPLSTSARNMGKNDLWIAASASVAGASLITTDKDFDHLHGEFVEVIWIDPATT